MISAEEVKTLMIGGESSQVDFKKSLSIATAYEKAEFLKDMMAFANSHSLETAYILFGVDNAGRNCGLAEPILDEASLQQLVADNIDPVIKFAFYTVTLDSVRIGVLEIPASAERFHIARKNIGEHHHIYLRQGELCIRRGTSKMPLKGEDFRLLKEEYADRTPQPKLQVCFAGASTTMETVRTWPTPEHILSQIISYCALPAQQNMRPYKFVPLRFYIHNEGCILATPLKVELTFPAECEVLFAPGEELRRESWSIKTNRRNNTARIYGKDLIHGDHYSPGEIYVRFLRRDKTYDIGWKASAGNMLAQHEGTLTVCIMPQSD